MIASRSAGVELGPLVPGLELVDGGSLRARELLGALLDLAAQRVGQLVEQRRDRVGVVEELAAVADRGDRRLDVRRDRQAVGVAEEALEVVPLGLALLALLVGRPPAFEVAG